MHNNDLDNIEFLCYSCHGKEHEIYKNFKYIGYDAVIAGKLKKLNNTGGKNEEE